MNVEFRSSFRRDLKRVKDKSLLKRVREAVEAIEQTGSIENLPNLKKLKSSKNYFRLRIGEYRVGLAVENDLVVFVRFLNRRDIYKYFP